MHGTLVYWVGLVVMACNWGGGELFITPHVVTTLNMLFLSLMQNAVPFQPHPFINIYTNNIHQRKESKLSCWDKYEPLWKILISLSSNFIRWLMLAIFDFRVESCSERALWPDASYHNLTSSLYGCMVMQRALSWSLMFRYLSICICIK